MAYAGIDTINYPGDKTMEWLWDEANSNLWWVGYYLPEKGSSQTWKGKFTRLKAMGWGVAPIYIGKQPAVVKAYHSGKGKAGLQGYFDGITATVMASTDKIPEGTVIYFDLEGGDISSSTHVFMEYFKNWMKCVIERGYIPGLYCSYLLAPQMTKVMITVQGPPLIWAVRYIHKAGKSHKNPYPTDPPVGSNFPMASSWQLAGNNWITGPNQTKLWMDLNTSIWQDPGLRQ